MFFPVNLTSVLNVCIIRDAQQSGEGSLMAARKKDRDDSTRKRILAAAGALFAEKGFARTTVRDICARAEVNLALVNYHFRSKEGLYRAVWRHAVELAETLYPIDGGVPAKSPAEARLRGFVRALLSRMTDRNRLGHFHGIRMMEFSNPTGLSNEIFAGMVRAPPPPACNAVLTPPIFKTLAVLKKSCEAALYSGPATRAASATALNRR